MLTKAELINKIEEVGKENIRFLVPMRPIRDYGFVTMTSSSDSATLVECRIDETEYRIEQGYKMTLRAIDPKYGWDHYYIDDVVSLIERGSISIVEPGKDA